MKALINDLVFTTQGYDRAKNVLTTKFGWQNEVVNVYIESLPTIQHYQLEKIYNFYEKLASEMVN